MTSMFDKSLRVTLAAVLLLGLCAAPAAAQDDKAHQQALELAKAQGSGTWKSLMAIGAGIVTLGGGLAIGKLAAAAMEGTARQPEAGGAIRTSMIIAAALIEGFTFFALVVCIMAAP